MLNVKILVSTVLFLFVFSHTSAAKSSDNWSLIGKGSMTVAIWDIYEARLYSLDGTFRDDQPFALNIKYLRPVKKSLLIKETVKQWEHIGVKDEALIQSWVEQLEVTWVDVKKGDELSMVVTENQHAKFLLNQEELGVIPDSKFSRYFSSIWLSHQTSQPKLRKQLLGYRQ